MALTENEFNRTADATIAQIERALDAAGVDDIDYETVADILTIEFANGSKIIVNKQGAAKQLWVAARSGGFHYNYDAASGTWHNDQGGGELFAELAVLIGQQAGTTVRLAAD